MDAPTAVSSFIDSRHLRCLSIVLCPLSLSDTYIVVPLFCQSRDKGTLLTKWKKKHEELFPGDAHDIPDAASFNLSKLDDGGIVSTDTCPAAQLLNKSLVDEIVKQGKERDLLRKQTIGDVLVSVVANVANSEAEGEVASVLAGTIETDVDVERRKVVLSEFCHHHIRNIWSKAVINKASQFLEDMLQADLSLIDARYRVDADMNAICRAIYKLFSLNCNYAKGLGEEFLQWAKEHHIDFMLIPIARLSGSREDAIIEGACSIYWNRPVYVDFIEETIGTPGCDNLLLDSLAIILRSEEICCLTRVLAILHYSIAMPMRWLCAKTHELAAHNWSVRSMGRAVDLLHDALQKIKVDPKLYLDEGFMNTIFQTLRHVSYMSCYYCYVCSLLHLLTWTLLQQELSEFDEYLNYIFEQKTSASVLKRGKKSAMKTHKLVREELFNPQRPENKETTELALKLGVMVAEVMLEEFYHPKKVTRHYLSAIGGKHSWAMSSEEEKKAGLAKKANNDEAEGPFAYLSRMFDVHGRLDSRNASAVATAIVNKIFYRNDVEKSKKKADDDSIPSNGIFITLSDELKQSLLTLAKELNNSEKEKYAEQRERQRKTLEQKKEAARKHAIEKAKKSYMDTLYFFDLLHSDECITNATDLDRVLQALPSKTAKMAECKKQIKIWSVGAGRKDWHKPWSSKGVAFTWEELAAHLKEFIYPKLSNFNIPADAPAPKMPFTRTLPQLGKIAADVRAKLEEKEEFKSEFIDSARKLKETKYCPDGHIASIDDVGDRIGRRIGMKFEYVESSDDSKMNMWCYGEVVGVTRCNKFHILWDDEYVEEGCPNITMETLDEGLFNQNAAFGWHVLKPDLTEEDHDDSIFDCRQKCM
eukprot:scaffold4425_cov91-Skeletonema_menzelii.AAC.1